MNRTRIPYGSKVDLLITQEHRELILGHTFIGVETERALNLAVSRGTGLVARLRMEDLDDLLGHVAAAANHAKSRRVQKRLDEIFVRLKGIEDLFEEEEP